MTAREIDDFLASLPHSRSWQHRLRQAVPLVRNEHLSARAVGGRLFTALMSGPVGATWAASKVRADGRGLRLHLRIDPDGDQADRLQRLPWEFIRDPATGAFLARDLLSSVVRHLEVSHPAALPTVPRPLRILMATPSPRDRALLDTRAERDALCTLAAAHGAIEAWFLPTAGRKQRTTLEALRQTAIDQAPHVLQISSHGALNQADGTGEIDFESADGLADPIPGEMLADALRDQKSIRLVLLNACQSGAGSTAAGKRSFANLATALIESGVPAVIAMQAAISDRAAIAFSGELYHRLACGDALDAAVTEARRAIDRPGAGDEWGTPMLFLRSRQARLFEPLPAGVERLARPALDRAHLGRLQLGWHRQGVAWLLATALALSLGGGFLYLALWPFPAWREALTIAAVTFTGALGFLALREPDHGRRLSHAVVALPGLRPTLLVFFLALATTWAVSGRTVLCGSAYGPLGCPPPGVERLDILPLTNRLPTQDPLAAAWTADIEDGLSDRFKTIGTLEVLPPRGAAADDRNPGAHPWADLTLQASLGREGELLVLRGEMRRRGGQSLGVVRVVGPPDPTGQTLHTLRARFADAIFHTLGPDAEAAPDEKSPGEAPPGTCADKATGNPDALELERQALVSFLLGDLERAELQSSQALELDPGLAEAMNNRGRARHDQGELALAIADFRAAIACRADHPSFHFNLGLALDESGETEAAIDSYQRATSLDPSHAAAWNNLGVVLLDLGSLGEARASLERGLIIASDTETEAALRKNLGRLALLEGDGEGALAQLAKVGVDTMVFREALSYRALAHRAIGQQETACATWHELLTASNTTSEQQQNARREMRLDCAPTTQRGNDQETPA